MSNRLISLIIFSFLLFFSVFIPSVNARTTPEDIVNERKADYNARIKNYSEDSKQKLESLSRKIELINDKQAAELEELMVRQGQILDEFIRRNELKERQADGIHRNLSNPIENARYWLTFAHEAVAYQAAHVYIVNVTGEKNLKSDITGTINQLQSDMSVLKGKVQKSQGFIEELVNE